MRGGMPRGAERLLDITGSEVGLPRTASGIGEVESAASRFPDLPIVHYTERVATAGGTFEARVAGPNTASWPSSHSTSTPPPRYASGRRGDW